MKHFSHHIDAPAPQYELSCEKSICWNVFCNTGSQVLWHWIHMDINACQQYISTAWASRDWLNFAIAFFLEIVIHIIDLDTKIFNRFRGYIMIIFFYAWSDISMWLDLRIKLFIYMYILCFETATQEAKSWFCECHQTRISVRRKVARLPGRYTE